LFDFGKGFLPVFLANSLGLPTWVSGVSGILSVTGHCWSIYMRFDGGEGMMTAMGVLVGLAPIEFTYALAAAIIAVPISIILGILAAYFRNSIFDRIISIVAINYFVNPEKELRKLRASLKKDGKVSFLALRAHTITVHPFLRHDRTIKTIFKEAGFKDIKIERVTNQFTEYIYITARK